LRSKRSSASLLAPLVAGLSLAATASPAGADLRFEPGETVLFQDGGYLARTETVEIADVTGDGRKDLLAATSAFGGENEYSLFVLEQLEDGTLAAPVRYDTTGSNTEDWMGLGTGDFDADGRRDVAVATFEGVNLFFQTPEGTLAGPQFPNMLSGDLGGTQGYPPRSRYLAAGDIDGDGLDDIVATTNLPEQIGSRCNGIAVLRQADEGGFDGIHLAADQCAGEIELGDLTGDGLNDILSGHYLFVSQSGGGFEQQALAFGGTLEVADVSGDGRDDAIFGWSGEFGERVRVLRQDAQGQLGDETSCTQRTTYSNPLEAADIDGDGLTDIVSGDYPGVFVQRDDGTFSERIPIDVVPARVHVDNVALGDLNSDGRVDVATAGVDRIGIARQAADSGPIEPQPEACDNEAPEVELATTAGLIELDPEGFAPLPFSCPETERSKCDVRASLRTKEPVLFEGALQRAEFGDAGASINPGETSTIHVGPAWYQEHEWWRLLSEHHELEMVAEIEAVDEAGNGLRRTEELVLRTPVGYRRERRSLTLATSSGAQVLATPGFYHCVPHADGTKTCLDRRPGPLPTSTTLPAHPCGRLSMESGYPTWGARAVLESRGGANLRSLNLDRTSNSRVYELDLPARIPRSSDRIHVFVRHKDTNRGDFEAAIRRASSRCP
jgi:hypothetical protein